MDNVKHTDRTYCYIRLSLIMQCFAFAVKHDTTSSIGLIKEMEGS